MVGCFFIFLVSCLTGKGGFIKGIIIRIESKDYYVSPLEGDKSIRCSLRGKFKKEFGLKKDKLYQTDFAAIGDYVEINMNNDGTGVINSIEGRRNYVSRKSPRIKGAGFRGERLEQIVAANINKLIIVSSVAEPEFNNKVIDRFIAAGESSQINIIIIINKIDLKIDNSIDEWIKLYQDIGYTTIESSVVSAEGLEKIKDELKGNKNLLWGHSGVGKSSLLNRIYTDLNLNVGEISSYTDKGTHTTVTSTMLKVEDDTYIIDTPGIREIVPFGISNEDLSHYFIEFLPYLQRCHFNRCTHNHEPDCAVIEAVEDGEISMERYESYLRILETIEEDIIY